MFGKSRYGIGSHTHRNVMPMSQRRTGKINKRFVTLVLIGLMSRKYRHYLIISFRLHTIQKIRIETSLPYSIASAKQGIT